VKRAGNGKWNQTPDYLTDSPEAGEKFGRNGAFKSASGGNLCYILLKPLLINSNFKESLFARHGTDQ
jgi:hypothetical protein